MVLRRSPSAGSIVKQTATGLMTATRAVISALVHFLATAHAVSATIAATALAIAPIADLLPVATTIVAAITIIDVAGLVLLCVPRCPPLILRISGRSSQAPCEGQCSACYNQR